jgi:cytidine deaminase
MPNQNDIQLLRKAADAARKAHAPYSSFRVGAALLTRNGKVFTGCNVENASYGLTICAERVALFSAVAAGHRKFAKLAVVAGEKNPAYPCGACLQVMAEFCDPGMPVLLAPLDAPTRPLRLKLKDLLPKAFRMTDRSNKQRRTEI